MTRWAWTGSRKPSGGFTPDELIAITLDVAFTVHNGDEVGTGGCSGVDEQVIRTAWRLKQSSMSDLKIETWTANGEKSWGFLRAPTEVIMRSNVVHEHDWKYLERDRALVDWADFVKAIPLQPFEYTDMGTIVMRRSSGTNYTARYSEHEEKIIAVMSLRPMTRAAIRHCVGRPVQLRTAVGTFCANQTAHQQHNFLRTA